MTKLITAFTLAALLSLSTAPAFADDTPSSDAKPSDFNLKSSDGTAKLWTLQVWNSGA